MKLIYDADWENNNKLNFIRIWFARTTGQDKHLKPLEIVKENDNFGQLKLEI